MPGRGSYTDLVNVKPYCRIATYLVGIAQGYLIHIEKKNPGKNPLVSSRSRGGNLIVDDNAEGVKNNPKILAITKTS